MSQLPSASEIRYFLEVATTLNISRAAERLGISQPSLSLAIQRLEDAVGTGLLVRGKSGVQLSQAGKKFSLQARALVEEWERLRNSVIDDEEKISGRFTVGCHPSVALYTLPVFLADLLVEYPDLEVTLSHDLSRKITEGVVSFKIDFGLVVNPVKHPDLVIKKILEDEVGFWTGPDKTNANNMKGPDAVLICDADLLQTQSLLKGARRSSLDFRRIVTSSNLEVITSLVASGCGIGVLPERVATRIPSLGLKKAGPGLPTFKDEICLIYRADAQRTKASKVIVEAIQDSLG